MKNENPDLQSDCSVHTTLKSHRGCLSEYAKEIGLKSRLVLAFAKSCILKVSQDFKTFLRSLARLSRLSRLLKPERYTMNIV